MGCREQKLLSPLGSRLGLGGRCGPITKRNVTPIMAFLMIVLIKCDYKARYWQNVVNEPFSCISNLHLKYRK